MKTTLRQLRVEVKNSGRRITFNHNYARGVIETDSEGYYKKGSLDIDTASLVKQPYIKFKRTVRLINILSKPLLNLRAKKRLNLCKVCAYFNADLTACSKCGCAMNLKARLRNQHCPIGKW